MARRRARRHSQYRPGTPKRRVAAAYPDPMVKVAPERDRVAIICPMIGEYGARRDADVRPRLARQRHAGRAAETIDNDMHLRRAGGMGRLLEPGDMAAGVIFDDAGIVTWPENAGQQHQSDGRVSHLGLPRTSSEN